jgi:hypothetical protein
MTLQRGSFRRFEFDRLVVLFSMMDGTKEVPCAVSTSAMDDLDRSADETGSARRAISAIARPDRTMRVS